MTTLKRKEIIGWIGKYTTLGDLFHAKGGRIRTFQRIRTAKNSTTWQTYDKPPKRIKISIEIIEQ